MSWRNPCYFLGLTTGTLEPAPWPYADLRQAAVQRLSVDMASNFSDRQIIEVRVAELAQLFNSLDPSPFTERDLDDKAAEYIVGWARELPRYAKLAIAIHLPAFEAKKAEERGLRLALRNYFQQRAEAEQRELNELFRNGRRYAAIGLPILVVCFMLSQIVRSRLGTGPLASTIAESFLLVGWVANWKPIETFLYDWWPLKRRRDLYRRLAAAEIVIEPTD
ncbi:hypothetical protein [Hyphomicrobium sp.]|uniref:hypothetical protein n=1 Tax=Hyphomicrobium sp. TaxID=82 RepID=UPI0025BE76A1|nr:hypothetical protein [Hyphomicrobium sp.]